MPLFNSYLKQKPGVTLSSDILGTANQIIVTDNGDDTVTLSLPQDYDTSAIPTLGGLITTGTVDASAGEVLVSDNDTSEPTGKSDGYIGVAEISSTGRIYFFVNGTRYFIDATSPIVGQPMGLLLALTYA